MAWRGYDQCRDNTVCAGNMEKSWFADRDNIVRKTAVSAIHQKHPGMKESLANLMCHNVSTATRCYCVMEREHSSVATSKQLAETIRTPAVHQNSSHITAASGSHTKDEDGRSQETEALAQNSCDDTDVVPPSVTSRWSKEGHILGRRGNGDSEVLWPYNISWTNFTNCSASCNEC